MSPRAESLLPEQFGPLQGVRILSTGTIVAQPFAAALAAEMGAEVIQIERPRFGDVTRGTGVVTKVKDGLRFNPLWLQDRRNTFHTTLDFTSREGREMFLRLIAGVDIWMESSKAGTFTEWDLDDATVLAANPAIVITHVSGYGQTGHPDYLNRASYDPIGQAFGGTMAITGSADPEPPMTARPLAADYTTSQMCLWSSLAAYIHAQSTGKGQVIDLAQYEAVHKVMSGSMVEYFETEIVPERRGNQSGRSQPFGTYHAKDGWVAIAALGTVFDRVCRVLGMDTTAAYRLEARSNPESIPGIEFDAILRGWLEDHTVKEVVEIMNAAQIGCSAVMTTKDIAEDPHYRAREIHTEWDDLQLGRKVKGTGIIPKFSETPGKIWRGSVPLGHDNDLVYRHHLGMSDADLDRLREQGII
ncbi:MAG: CoA transferase [Chloroflexi bacterium]|jgi:crotonobetainyl-CoA:carnitine CoA-transferase CaiB-like acyl-CoA transferase|nr:CoA transferase [Chloroflexota bacterium]MQG54196.1 CoA transferase [SAR202 cluster bacterium]|tara:strand:+ start:57949 stop:59193 length:1245 start_codon:yes stop_codon:yes gene_type:complete